MRLKRLVLLTFWNTLYPFLAIGAAPFWILKMLRRDGWGTGLSERLGFYGTPPELERQGGVYLHAVSVGEVLLALRLINTWRTERNDHFVLVPTTATGMAVAREHQADDLRIIYAPLDLGFLVSRVLKRFSPRAVIMIESELWPNLISKCHRAQIPIGIANARLSPRSGRRLAKFKGLVEPFLCLLNRVGVPEKEDLERWQKIGVRKESVVLTGNVKFDPASSSQPRQRPEFAEMLSRFPRKKGELFAMAVSTFAGEEEYLNDAILEAGLFPVIVPRHAERKNEVVSALKGQVVLRSEFKEPKPNQTFVIDSTGELRDWTAHADVVIIGKSFISRGGQNPSEAILAGVPVICGPYMENFEPLVSELVSAGGIRVVKTRNELLAALREVPGNQEQIRAAREVLEKHQGAMLRTIKMFDSRA